MTGLSSRAWPGPGPGQGPGQDPVCSRAGVGRALEKIICPKLPMYAGWCGGAKPPTPHIYRQIPKLLARPIGVLTLGKVAASSSPKHLLSHFPQPLFANSLELSFAKLIA